MSEVTNRDIGIAVRSALYIDHARRTVKEWDKSAASALHLARIILMGLKCTNTLPLRIKHLESWIETLTMDAPLGSRTRQGIRLGINVLKMKRDGKSLLEMLPRLDEMDQAWIKGQTTCR